MSLADSSPLDRARRSLDGLSVGDAFGERFFGDVEVAIARIEEREAPPGPWRWTDDTAMGLSIVAQLEEHGSIIEAELAARFRAAYMAQPGRATEAERTAS